MEQLPNFENREGIIDKLIENLAEKEGMEFEDVMSDIITFAEISKEDEDAKAYFEIIADMVGVSFEEMMEYAIKKAKE